MLSYRCQTMNQSKSKAQCHVNSSFQSIYQLHKPYTTTLTTTISIQTVTHLSLVIFAPYLHFTLLRPPQNNRNNNTVISNRNNNTTTNLPPSLSFSLLPFLPFFPSFPLSFCLSFFLSFFPLAGRRKWRLRYSGRAIAKSMTRYRYQT